MVEACARPDARSERVVPDTNNELPVPTTSFAEHSIESCRGHAVSGPHGADTGLAEHVIQAVLPRDHMASLNQMSTPRYQRQLEFQLRPIFRKSTRSRPDSSDPIGVPSTF